MNNEQREGLSECLASLIVGSLAMRNRIRRNIEYYRERFGIADTEADKSLMVMNMPMLDRLPDISEKWDPKYVSEAQRRASGRFGSPIPHHNEALSS